MESLNGSLGVSITSMDSPVGGCGAGTHLLSAWLHCYDSPGCGWEGSTCCGDAVVGKRMVSISVFIAALLYHSVCLAVAQVREVQCCCHRPCTTLREYPAPQMVTQLTESAGLMPTVCAVSKGMRRCHAPSCHNSVHHNNGAQRHLPSTPHCDSQHVQQ